MQTILVDIENGSIKPVDVPDSLDAFYELLHCRAIDITQRKIKGKRFDVMCDDEGGLKDRPLVSAYSSRGRVALVGNLMFFHTDRDGNLVGISDDECVHILSCVETAIDLDSGSCVPVVTQCDPAY